MASKTKKRVLKKHCRIFPWIEAHDPDLAGAIRDLCMEGALSPGRGGGGVTFLYPEDAAYRKKIVDDAYSDEAESAIRHIESLIIVSKAMKSASDFEGDIIGTRGGVRLEVEKVEKGEVELRGGIKLAPADDFSPVRRDNIAVWVITSTDFPPLEGEAYEAPQRARRGARGGSRRGSKMGGGMPGQLPARGQLAINLEVQFQNYMSSGNWRAQTNPYIPVLVGLFNFLKEHAADFWVKIHPILDRNPVTCFYIVLQPFRKSDGGDDIIPDDVLFGSKDKWDEAVAAGATGTDYLSFFDEKILGETAGPDRDGAYSVPLIYQRPGEVRNAVDEARVAISNKGSALQRCLAIRAAYANLAQNNAIVGLSGVLPSLTLEISGGSDVPIRWRDEFRFLIDAGITDLISRGFTADGWERIRGALRDRSGTNPAQELTFTNPDFYKPSQNVDPQEESRLLDRFLKSTDFLYMAVPSGMVGGGFGDIPMKTGGKAFHAYGGDYVWDSEPSKREFASGRRGTDRAPSDAGDA